MAYLILGSIAFLFFILYDLNTIFWQKKTFSFCFFLGFFSLIISTVGILSISLNQFSMNIVRTGIFSSISLLFFILLIYTLFFALPFKKTYIKIESSPDICQHGVYALCRHPGVLWFIGFYFSLWLTVQTPLLLKGSVFFSLWNILYVVFQDKWSFMKIFQNYGDYKKSTPFLIPNTRSIQRCLRTWH